jgi:hypothetical protein
MKFNKVEYLVLTSTQGLVEPRIREKSDFVDVWSQQEV